MGYFNYHAKVRKLIEGGHCTFAQIKDNHNGISPALLLHFDNHAPMPIRLNHFDEYFNLLRSRGVPISRDEKRSPF